MSGRSLEKPACACSIFRQPSFPNALGIPALIVGGCLAPDRAGNRTPTASYDRFEASPATPSASAPKHLRAAPGQSITSATTEVGKPCRSAAVAGPNVGAQGRPSEARPRYVRCAVQRGSAVLRRHAYAAAVGSVLRAAERRKHTVYPELTHSGPQPLVGLAPALDHDQATRPCQCAFHARTPPSCGSLWLRAAIQPSLPRAAAALATPRVGFLSISYSSCPSCAKSPLSYPFARILYAALGVQLVR